MKKGEKVELLTSLVVIIVVTLFSVSWNWFVDLGLIESTMIAKQYFLLLLIVSSILSGGLMYLLSYLLISDDQKYIKAQYRKKEA